MIKYSHGEINSIRHNFFNSGSPRRNSSMAGRIIYKHSGFQLGSGFNSFGSFIDNIPAIRGKNFALVNTSLKQKQSILFKYSASSNLSIHLYKRNCVMSVRNSLDYLLF